MYISNVTNDFVYDNITDYDNISTLSNCTDSENNIDIIIQSLLLILPCALSFLCLLSLMVYTIIQPLFNDKSWEKYYTQNIQLGV